MKRQLSLILAVAIAMVLVVSCWTSAFAATSLTMAVGQEEPLEISNEIVTSAYSSNSSIVTVDRIAAGKAYVKAIASGSATITVYYTSNGVSRNYEFAISVDSPKVTVNLAGPGDFDMSTEVYFNVNSMRSSNERVCKAAFVNNTVVITATGEGSAVVTYDGYRNNKWESVQIQVNVGSGAIQGTNNTQPTGEDIALKVGETWNTQSFYATTAVRSDNDSVAKIATDAYGRNVVTATGIGTTNISYTYRLVANGPLTNVIHRVTVGTGSTTNTNTNTNTGNGDQDVTLTVGNSYYTSRYQILSVSSSNASVAQGTISGSALSGSNNMSLRIQGVGTGTAIVQMEYYDSATSAKMTQNFNVVVSASGTITTTTTPTSTITFAKTAYTIAKYNNAGQIVPYRINPRVNGATVSAGTMLWLSSDPSVFTIEATTGIIRGVKAGTARLICVDKTGGNISSVALTITN